MMKASEQDGSAQDFTASDQQPERRVSLWRLIVWNVLFFLFLAEIVALGSYFARTRTLYYLNPPVGKTIPQAANRIENYRIHPYFGFIIRPDATVEYDTSQQRERYNNHGFDSLFDYPVERRPGDLFIGILGGSVASKLAAFDRREGVLTQRLATATGRSQDQIRLINLAQGGYKQPQQNQTLVFFQSLGQELDAVVNIDGFNDIALAARNQKQGISAAMPSIEHVRALQNVTPMGQSSPGLAKMIKARRTFTKFTEVYDRAWSGKAWETRVASGFLFSLLRYKMLERKFHRLREQLSDKPSEDAGSRSWLYLERHEGTEEVVDWQPILNIWKESARALDRIAEGSQMERIHVIQPNQYFKTARVFSEAEQAIALNAQSPYIQFVADGYPLLVQGAAELSAEGVSVTELLELFDDLEAPAYEDDCCHYTDEGNHLLANRIADLLIERGFGQPDPTR